MISATPPAGLEGIVIPILWKGKLRLPKAASWVTGSATHILSPNPSTPCPFAWVSLYIRSVLWASPCSGPAWELPKSRHRCWEPQAPGRGFPAMLSLSGSPEDSPVEEGAGAEWAVQRSPGGRVPRDLHRAPSPAASRPCASERDPRVRPIPGRATRQHVSRGCFPAQWTKQFWCFREGTEHCVHLGGVQDSWTDTSVLSQATRLITQAPRPPHPHPHPFSLVTHSLQSKHLRRPFQVASGSGHLSHMPPVTGLVGGGRG